MIETFYNFSEQPGFAHFGLGLYMFSLSNKKRIMMNHGSINPGISSNTWHEVPLVFSGKVWFSLLCVTWTFCFKSLNSTPRGFEYIFMVSTTLCHVFFAQRVLYKYKVSKFWNYSLSLKLKKKICRGNIFKVFGKLCLVEASELTVISFVTLLVSRSSSAHCSS